MEPFLSRITIYPVKSLNGISLQQAMISKGGCLLHDREYAMCDEKGNFINGKRNPLVHALRSNIDLDNEIISFNQQHQIKWDQFHMQKDKTALQSYLSNYFGLPIIFKQNNTGRFLDMPDVSGVTVLSESSLQSVSKWFGNLDLAETRKRFRATIELDGVPAFWEDHLFSLKGKGVAFKIGDVSLLGMSPQAKCIVPTRNTETGEVIHAFPKTFARNRKLHLPAWSLLKEFSHYYYLSVNCLIPESEVGKWIKLGDKVMIMDK